MPLKIRCPHCRRTLVAEDETAGQEKLCPVCGQVFTVPIPIHYEDRESTVGETCEKCGADVAPGTAYCPKCFTDRATGKRLPWKKRAQFVSIRTWSIAGLGTIAVIVSIFVGLNFYNARESRLYDVRRPDPVPQTQPADVGVEWARRLLRAATPSDRVEAAAQLSRLGHSALPALARELEGASTPEPGAQLARNKAAAIDLFGRSGETRWLELLRQLDGDARVHDASLHARARLGDQEVAAGLGSEWNRRLRRQLFLERVTELAPSSVAGAADALNRAEHDALERTADALRQLQASPEARGLEQALEAYWDSWSWLGQRRGDSFAAAIFELAKPPQTEAMEFKERVRYARRALDREGERASATARAATAAVAVHNIPQYRSLRGRMVETLAGLLSQSTPIEQQRLAWALARLANRPFGEHADSDHPLDFTRSDVLAADKWARQSNLIDEGGSLGSGSYPVPPRLTRRVITPRRQLEQTLLENMRGDWSSLDDALDRWMEAGLGCTPRVVQLLDPGQRRPDYPLLAAAMILAAECGDQDLRPRLSLWLEASDQPAWVGWFAGTVLAALDERRAARELNWPIEIDLATLGGGDAPDLKLCGRLIAVGGPQLREALRKARSDVIDSRLRDQLLIEVDRAAARRIP